MSNANLVPLGTNRRMPGGDYGNAGASNQDRPPAGLQASTFVDAMGRPIAKQAASGGCPKCGFAGHLPYQCRNNMPMDVAGSFKRPIEVSSTSSPSSDYDTPLKKEDRKLKKKSVKELKKELKRLKKQKKKSSKKRKRAASSSDEDADSSDSGKKAKKRKKHKKEKKAKSSKKHKRHRSSSSSDSSD